MLVLALVMYAAMLLAGPSPQLLLPVLADERLHTGPAMLGILFSAGGAGAVLGAVVAGTLPRANIRWIRAAVVLWCGAMVWCAGHGGDQYAVAGYICITRIVGRGAKRCCCGYRDASADSRASRTKRSRDGCQHAVAHGRAPIGRLSAWNSDDTPRRANHQCDQRRSACGEYGLGKAGVPGSG